MSKMQRLDVQRSRGVSITPTSRQPWGNCSRRRERAFAQSAFARVLDTTHGRAAQLEHADSLELIYRNPAERERPATPPEPQLTRLPAADVLKLMETAARFEHPLHCCVELALQRTLRKEGLLGLRWQDVDLDNGFVQVRQTVTFERGKAIVGPPKTKKARRTVEIEPETVALLQTRKLRVSAHRRSRLEAKRRWVDGGLVFPSRVATPNARQDCP